VEGNVWGRRKVGGWEWFEEENGWWRRIVGGGECTDRNQH
jgi:hypothetical protein